MDDNDYQLSTFQLFTVVISNKYYVLKFCPLVLDATVCVYIYIILCVCVCVCIYIFNTIYICNTSKVILFQEVSEFHIYYDCVYIYIYIYIYILNTPVTTCVTITLTFNSFFQLSDKIFSLTFIFTLGSGRMAKSTRWQDLSVFCFVNRPSVWSTIQD